MYVPMYLCAHVSTISSNAQMYELATISVVIIEQGPDQQD